MVTVNNIPEQFYREVRKVEIYDAEKYPYQKAFLEEVLTVSPTVVFERIIPEEFNRKIQKKNQNHNEYYEVDFSFPVYSLHPIERKEWDILLNKKDFVAVVYTNSDVLIVGNHIDKLTVETQDQIKADNSGNDKIQINIYGKTMIEPIIYPL